MLQLYENNGWAIGMCARDWSLGETCDVCFTMAQLKVQPYSVTLRGLSLERAAILLLIYKAIEMAALHGTAPCSPG